MNFCDRAVNVAMRAKEISTDHQNKVHLQNPLLSISVCSNRGKNRQAFSVPNMAIESRLTEKKMIDTQSYLNREGHSLVKENGDAHVT